MNIYLHELDVSITAFTQGLGVKKTNVKTLTPIAKEYKNRKKVLSNKVKKLEKGVEGDKTLKEVKANKLKSILCRTYIDRHDRVYYHRYADEFIVGVAGSKDSIFQIQ